LTGTKQREQIRPKPGKIEEETKWFSPNRIEAKQANLQWWANLDQAPEDLDKTIFRALSPTPKP
jgi:hypothetical protein